MQFPPQTMSMAELARKIGVSPMTVSRVLSGVAGKVAPETRERVLAEAQRMKIEVNHLARSYYSQKTGVIGVVTPFRGLLGSEYFARVVLGIRQALGEDQWGIALFDTRAESVDCGEILDRYYRQRRVDGFLIIAPTSEDTFVESLGALEAPLVLVGEVSQNKNVYCVDIDPEGGMNEALDVLYEKGHRNIGFLRGPENLGTALRRWQVFCRFMQAKSLPIEDRWCPLVDFTRRGGHRAACEILRSSLRPSALVASNDLMALGAYDGALELGLHIPQQLSVIGFDNIDDAAASFPALSTVEHPMERIGKEAGVFLKAMLAGEPRNSTRQSMLPSRFIARGSHCSPEDQV